VGAVPFIIKNGPFAAILLFDFDIIMLFEIHYKTMLQPVFNKRNLCYIRSQYCTQIQFPHSLKDFTNDILLRKIGEERNRS